MKCKECKNDNDDDNNRMNNSPITSLLKPVCSLDAPKDE